MNKPTFCAVYVVDGVDIPALTVERGNTSTPVMPPPVSERKAGQTYQTPKGPLKWTGTGWAEPGPPVSVPVSRFLQNKFRREGLAFARQRARRHVDQALALIAHQILIVSSQRSAASRARYWFV